MWVFGTICHILTNNPPHDKYNEILCGHQSYLHAFNKANVKFSRNCPKIDILWKHLFFNNQEVDQVIL